MNKKADSRIVAKSWVITQIKKTNRNTIFPKPFKQIYINPMFLFSIKSKKKDDGATFQNKVSQKFL